MEDNERKYEYNIAQNFKNRRDRLPRKSGEDIEKYFKTYETSIVN